MQRNVERMLKAHPEQPLADAIPLSECIRACVECAQACNACADASLSEHIAEPLTHCIRLNQDCSDICATTARILSRQTAPDLGLVTMVVELCAASCDATALECGRHAPYHMHCQICAASCRRAVEACAHVLSAATTASRLHH